MEIAKAEISDAKTVGYIHATAWKQAYENVFPEEYICAVTPAVSTQEFLDSCNNIDAFCFLIYEAGLAVGVIKVIKQPDGYEILSLYILEEYRSSGIGRQTILHLNELFVGATMRLWVLEDNKRARNFYENNGFRSTGNTRIIERGKPYRQMEYIKN